MTNRTYQFGSLLVVFGGFLTLSRAQFGGEASLIGTLGLLAMFFGMLVGTFGLAVPSQDSTQSR